VAQVGDLLCRRLAISGAANSIGRRLGNVVNRGYGSARQSRQSRNQRSDAVSAGTAAAGSNDPKLSREGLLAICSGVQDGIQLL